MAQTSKLLQQERDEWQQECLEQARMNGMGSEREAKLLAQIADLTRDAKVGLALNQRLLDRLAGLQQDLGETRQHYVTHVEEQIPRTEVQDLAILKMIFPRYCARAQSALSLAEELAQALASGALNRSLLSQGHIADRLQELFPHLMAEVYR